MTSNDNFTEVSVEKIKIIEISKDFIDFNNVSELFLITSGIDRNHIAIIMDYQKLNNIWNMEIDVNDILLRNIMNVINIVPKIVKKSEKSLRIRPAINIAVMKDGEIIGIAAETPIEIDEIVTNFSFRLDYFKLIKAKLNTIINHDLYTFYQMYNQSLDETFKFSVNDIPKIMKTLLNNFNFALSTTTNVVHNFIEIASTDDEIGSLDITNDITDTIVSNSVIPYIDILINLCKQLGLGLGWEYYYAPIIDLHRINALDLFYAGISEGIDSDIISSFIDEMKINQTRHKHETLLENNSNHSMCKARQMMIIIEDKFGKVKINEIIEKLRLSQESRLTRGIGGNLAKIEDSVIINNYKSVLKCLSNSEAKVIELEYENKMKEWNESLTNKCSHIKLLSKFLRSSNDKEKSSTLKLIIDLCREKLTSMEILTCKICNFNLICPHIIERTSSELKRIPYNAIRMKLMKYAVRIANNTDSHSYYCKICSAKLSEAYTSDETTQKDLYGELDSDLKSRLYMIAIDLYRYMIFTIPCDEKQFAGNIVYNSADAMVNLIEQRKKKDFDYELKEKLDINLIAFASLLNLMDNKNYGFKGVKEGSKITKYAEVILQECINYSKPITQQISSINIEYIKNRFSEAYRLTKGIQIQEETNDVEVINNIKIDPVYKFASLMNVLAGMDDSFSTVMGQTPKELIRGAKAIAKDTDLAPLFTKNTNIPLNNVSYIIKNPKINLFGKIQPSRLKISSNDQEFSKTYPSGMKYYLGGNDVNITGGFVKTKSMKPKSNTKAYIFNESYNMIVDYVKNIDTDKKYDEYRKKLEVLLRIELHNKNEQAFNYQQIWYNHLENNKIQFVDVPVKISSLYDEKGIKHKWTIYVYSNISTTNDLISSTNIIDIPVNEIAVKITAGELVGKKLIDVKCSVCGVRKSQTDTLDENTVEKEYKLRNEIKMFYLFYNTRCPEGDIHDYTQTNSSCKKCGYKEGDNTREYFDKYHKKFNEDKLTMNQVTVFSTSTNAIAINLSNDITDITEDISNLLTLSKLMNIKLIELEAIGATEGIDYNKIDDLKLGEIKEYTNIRLLTLDSMIRMVIFRYNQVKFGIVDNNLIPKDSPEILYDRKILTARLISPESCYKYLLNKLAEILLNIHNISNEFAKSLVDEILKSSRLLSKPVNFNWSMFNNISSDSQEIPDQVADSAEDIGDERVLNGTEENVFSMEDLDMDIAGNDEDNPNLEFTDE